MNIQYESTRTNKALKAKILKDLSSPAVKNGKYGCLTEIALKHNVRPKAVSDLFRKRSSYK
jgi:hypothetical protein